MVEVKGNKVIWGIVGEWNIIFCGRFNIWDYRLRFWFALFFILYILVDWF